jgi:hypothetical protein
VARGARTPFLPAQRLNGSRPEPTQLSAPAPKPIARFATRWCRCCLGCDGCSIESIESRRSRPGGTLRMCSVVDEDGTRILRTLVTGRCWPQSARPSFSAVPSCSWPPRRGRRCRAEQACSKYSAAEVCLPVACCCCASLVRWLATVRREARDGTLVSNSSADPVHRPVSARLRSSRRSSCALSATTMVDSDIRIAPSAGASVIPAHASTPAARGIANAL